MSVWDPVAVTTLLLPRFQFGQQSKDRYILDFVFYRRILLLYSEPKYSDIENFLFILFLAERLFQKMQNCIKM